MTSRRIATSAGLIMLGNVASRLLGLVREQTIAALFGTTATASIFSAVSRVPTMVYDLLIGGAITAALVPVFSEIAARSERSPSHPEQTTEHPRSGSAERQGAAWRGEGSVPPAATDELRRVSGAVLGLALLVLLPTVTLLVLFARPLIGLLGVGFSPDVQEQGVLLTRIALPSVLFLGVAAVLMAVLYALHRVTLPSFAAAIYNVGIIACALALARPFGVAGLVIGLLVGAAGQMLLQLIGLRDRLPQLSIDLKQPAVRRIVRLYAPVAAGLVVSALVVVLDTRLASLTGDASLAAMRYATQVVQLPLGLVATALSFAVLPVLSRYGAAGATDPAFRDTLALGIKAALFLIAPLTVALIVLREPVIALLFQRYAFGAADVVLTSEALLFYAPQLPFVAVDQLLIAAFYALQNTRLPVIVGVVCAALYAAVATLSLEQLGMAGLVLANTVQNSAHAVILLALLAQRHATAMPPDLVRSTARVATAAALMAVACAAFQRFAPAPVETLPLAAYLTIALGAGGAIYVLALLAMRGEEVHLARGVVLSRLRPRSRA